MRNEIDTEALMARLDDISEAVDALICDLCLPDDSDHDVSADHRHARYDLGKAAGCLTSAYVSLRRAVDRDRLENSGDLMLEQSRV